MSSKKSTKSDSNKLKLAFVVSQTNYDHTYLMEKRAVEHAEFLGCIVKTIAKVPGSYDMPLVIKKMLSRSDIDGVVTLGSIIKGDTDHDQVIAAQVTRKITDLSLEFDKPVGLGISGPGMTMMQSKARIEKFAVSAVEAVVKVIKELDKIE